MNWSHLHFIISSLYTENLIIFIPGTRIFRIYIILFLQEIILAPPGMLEFKDYNIC